MRLVKRVPKYGKWLWTGSASPERPGQVGFLEGFHLVGGRPQGHEVGGRYHQPRRLAQVSSSADITVITDKIMINAVTWVWVLTMTFMP